MVGDVGAAVAYAETELHAPTVAIVGASIGANSALVASSVGKVAAVVALSPGIDYAGIRPEPATYGPATYLVAAEDDKESADAVRQFARTGVNTKIWPKGGHGNKIIRAHPEELVRLVHAVADELE